MPRYNVTGRWGVLADYRQRVLDLKHYFYIRYALISSQQEVEQWHRMTSKMKSLSALSRALSVVARLSARMKTQSTKGSTGVKRATSGPE